MLQSAFEFLQTYRNTTNYVLLLSWSHQQVVFGRCCLWMLFSHDMLLLIRCAFKNPGNLRAKVLPNRPAVQRKFSLTNTTAFLMVSEVGGVPVFVDSISRSIWLLSKLSPPGIGAYSLVFISLFLLSMDVVVLSKKTIVPTGWKVDHTRR
jgi:hypothetical protein